MSNPARHFLEPRGHTEVEPAWIERTIIAPYYQETATNGRELYFGAVPEVGHWLRVVVENDQLLTAYLDRRLIRRWGGANMALKPDEKKGVIGSILDSEPELIIRYYEDTDTLVLTNGLPGVYGETVAKGLVARSNEERDITSIVLEHAAELLRPYLFTEANQEK